VIGVVEAVRMEGDALVATIRLSSAPDVASTVQKIKEGTVRGVSIGYAVTRWAESVDPETRQRVRTATAWRIREVSAVAVPADPAATFRSHTMEQETETLDGRAALIQRVRAAHNLPEEWATRMADAGDELTDDEIRQDARDTALATRQTRTSPTIRTAAPAGDDPAVIRNRQAEALAARMGGEAPSDAARQYMTLSLHDLARDCLTRSGVPVNTLGTEEILTRAMHGTTDFPALLTESGNRVLAGAYRRAESPLKTIARQRTATDFRPLSVLKLGEFSGLKKVSEHGEIKAMTTGETKEGYSLETFGGTFALSRKALVNDDLGAFGRWSEMMGRAAAETEAAQLLGLLTQASGAGPVMGEDGKRLFHADHGNLAQTGAAPDESTLTAARKALRTMKGLDNKTPISATPRYILVGPELETDVEKLLASIYATTTSDVNPHAGKLSLLVEPRLGTSKAWYVFADPSVMPVLEFAYLSSAPGPQLASRDGWEILGREFRVVLDFGAGATDWRGAYRNAGE
jgi:phage major head subunit gpT-like protein